jgi:hypothetical protein
MNRRRQPASFWYSFGAYRRGQVLYLRNSTHSSCSPRACLPQPHLAAPNVESERSLAQMVGASGSGEGGVLSRHSDRCHPTFLGKYGVGKSLTVILPAISAHYLCGHQQFTQKNLHKRGRLSSLTLLGGLLQPSPRSTAPDATTVRTCKHSSAVRLF